MMFLVVIMVDSRLWKMMFLGVAVVDFRHSRLDSSGILLTTMFLLVIIVDFRYGRLGHLLFLQPWLVCLGPSTIKIPDWMRNLQLLP